MISTGAIFSADRKYRYRLHRIWQPALPLQCWVLLNPSTADETRDDPTIRRCFVRAINHGFGGIEIVNLFAWRSTNPRGMIAAPDPVGPENDFHIVDASRRARQVVCAWGDHGKFLSRADYVLPLLRHPHALRLTGKGQPEHPLYVPYAVWPSPLENLRELTGHKVAAGETVAK